MFLGGNKYEYLNINPAFMIAVVKLGSLSLDSKGRGVNVFLNTGKR